MYYTEAENSELGKCPYCGSDNIVYDTIAYDGDGGYSTVTCQDCEKDYQEHYILTFIGNFIGGKK